MAKSFKKVARPSLKPSAGDVDRERWIAEQTPVDAITIGERVRQIDESRIVSLMESIREIGLQSALQVYSPDDGKTIELIAGNHRLEACKRLGLATVPCQFLDAVNDYDRQLWEIDENLIRAELTPMQHAQHLARRKELLRLSGRLLEAGDNQHSEGPDKLSAPQKTSFTSDTAKDIGTTERDVRRSVARAEKIAPEVADKIAGTSLDKGVELDALASLPADQQHKAVDAVQSGDAVSVRDYAASVKPKAKKKKPANAKEKAAVMAIRTLTKADAKAVAKLAKGKDLETAKAAYAWLGEYIEAIEND